MCYYGSLDSEAKKRRRQAHPGIIVKVLWNGRSEEGMTMS
jgi:hypothetical protein